MTALGVGVYAVSRGNTALSQRMMRYRVGAQGATVLALVLGSLYHTTTKSSNRWWTLALHYIIYSIASKLLTTCKCHVLSILIKFLLKAGKQENEIYNNKWCLISTNREQKPLHTVPVHNHELLHMVAGFKYLTHDQHTCQSTRAVPILVSVSVSGQYQNFFKVSESVKYFIQVPILLFAHYIYY